MRKRLNFKILVNAVICSALAYFGGHPSHAETENTERYFAIDAEIIKKYEKVIASNGTDKVVSEVLAIPDDSWRVANLLMALTASNNNSDMRTALSRILFQQPSPAGQMSASHLRLLTNLCLTNIRRPNPVTPRPRGVMSDLVLQSRLLDSIASVLALDEQRTHVPWDAPPAQYLRMLLESAAAQEPKSAALNGEVQFCLQLINSMATDINSKKLQDNATPPDEISGSQKVNEEVASPLTDDPGLGSSKGE